MRKSKEERIIEHGEYMVKELHRVYDEGIGTDEYSKLLSEYKKLYRRYVKMIKLSDNMGHGIMEQNDVLNDNLQYTIKTARTKLMDNVTEHRKTKETSSRFQTRAKVLEDALQESYEANAQLEKQLNTYIKQYGIVQHNLQDDIADNKKSELLINPVEYKNMGIKQVLSMELAKDKFDFVLAKIALNNFSDMIETIEENSSINNFLLGTYKYLKNSLQKTDIVFHHHMAEFYVISRVKNPMEVKEMLENLNKKRRVLNFEIVFSIGLTQFVVGKDTEEIFLRRCDNAFTEALKSKDSEAIVK